MAKIMLVEDDNNLSEIYQARMMAEGYTVVAAHDGEEALALAAKEKPDLIISDVMMPKISGFEMLDILRNTQGLKDTKVIMLTALGQAEDKTRADTLGANRYLVKSQVTLEDIVKAAQELLTGADTSTSSPVSAPPTQPETTPAATPVTPTPVATPPTTPAPAIPQPLAVAPVPQTPSVTPVPVQTPSGVTPTMQTPAMQPTPEPITAPPSTSTTPPPTQPETTPAATPVTPTPVATPPTTPAPAIPQPAEPSQGTAPQSTAQEQTDIQKQIANFEQQPQPTPTQPVDQTPAASDDKIVADAVNNLVSSTSPQSAEPQSIPTPVATPPTTPAPAEPAPSSNGDNNASTRKKVIAPITDISSKPDLNTLLAAEEAKSGQATNQTESPTQQPIVNAQTQPGNVLMPTQTQPESTNNTGIDPNSIAL